MELEPFWHHFRIFSFFHIFEPKIAFFWKKKLKTFLNLHLEERSFLTIVIFRWYPPRKLALKFQIFKLKLLITFDVIVLDKFWGQIWNQGISLVNILENEENWRTLLITTHPTTHPSTHPPTRIIKVFEVSKKVDPRMCFWKLHFRFSYTY